MKAKARECKTPWGRKADKREAKESHWRKKHHISVKENEPGGSSCNSPVATASPAFCPR